MKKKMMVARMVRTRVSHVPVTAVAMRAKTPIAAIHRLPSPSQGLIMEPFLVYSVTITLVVNAHSSFPRPI